MPAAEEEEELRPAKRERASDDKAPEEEQQVVEVEVPADRNVVVFAPNDTPFNPNNCKLTTLSHNIPCCPGCT